MMVAIYAASGIKWDVAGQDYLVSADFILLDKIFHTLLFELS
jgi:hypothetical protein